MRKVTRAKTFTDRNPAKISNSFRCFFSRLAFRLSRFKSFLREVNSPVPLTFMLPVGKNEKMSLMMAGEVILASLYVSLGHIF